MCVGDEKIDHVIPIQRKEISHELHRRRGENPQTSQAENN